MLRVLRSRHAVASGCRNATVAGWKSRTTTTEWHASLWLVDVLRTGVGGPSRGAEVRRGRGRARGPGAGYEAHGSEAAGRVRGRGSGPRPPGRVRVAGRAHAGGPEACVRRAETHGKHAATLPAYCAAIT